MEILEQMAEAALARDALRLRSLVQDWVHLNLPVANMPRPTTTGQNVLVMSAALVELLALHQQQPPPAWAKSVGALAEPFFLIEAAANMKRLRTLCETQSPEPLRKRRSPHFLEFA